MSTLLFGCKNCDLVEAELRHQNRKVEELQAELSQTHSECEMLRNTVEHLTGRVPGTVTSSSSPAANAAPAAPSMDPVPTSPSAHPQRARPKDPVPSALEALPNDKPLRGASFSGSPRRLGAAACKLNIGAMSREKDFDSDGKSDGLTLNFTLVDADGDLVKLPGSAVVEVFEIQTNGRQRAIGVWEYDETELRRFWRSGMLGSGYQLTFGWQRAPSTENLRAVVHYRIEDGHEFEAAKDIRVYLSPRLQWHEAGFSTDNQ